MQKQKNIIVLGSTGSVGSNAVEVITQNPSLYRAKTLVARSNVEKLVEQISLVQPENVLINDNSLRIADRLEELVNQYVKEGKIGKKPHIVSGCREVLEFLSIQNNSHDIALMAISGIAALPLLVAIIQNIHKIPFIAIASKEAIICGGSVLMKMAENQGVHLIPIDSEHHAIFQLLQNNAHHACGIKKIILTASGGPFWKYSKDEMVRIAPDIKIEDAVRHPKWSMGRKISVDSATMMNKGLEVIEAMTLFALPSEKMEVLVHPQSLVHGIVEYGDGASTMYLSPCDMKIPIQSAFLYAYSSQIHENDLSPNLKELQSCNGKGMNVDLGKVHELKFYPADYERFPMLRIALEVARLGYESCVVLNIANEIAVELFLQQKINFVQMTMVLEYALKNFSNIKINSLEVLPEINLSIKRFLVLNLHNII